MEPVEAAGPAGYPEAFETDVALSDGATAFVRPIRPDDGERLTRFHARQSPESIYYRYFSPRPRLSERDVEHFTHLDYIDRFALIALRADEIIGVARYDRWPHRAEAEVAFFVDDANHGRGLATLLLEHLAARARAVGVRAFTASVLPDNRRMIGVFTQAGFETATHFADGVIEVRLGLQPTAEAEAAIEARARAAATEAVRRLLSPRRVALIGASRRPGTLGHDVLVNLQRAGFQGSVHPVNPEAEEVGGLPAVASILDLAEEIDLAVVAVPAGQVPSVIEECGRKQVYGAVILSAGFAESGPAGAALEAEVLRVARSWGVRLVGPSCLGIINMAPEVRLHATFANVAPRPGRVSLLSESGMVGAAIVGRAREEGVGISSFVALGNRADVSGNDLLQYWETDAGTDVVCMYIESFGNPRHFSRLARRLTRTKPVVAVKAGPLPSRDRAAGTDETEGALLRQTGVIRVPTLTALLDTARLLTTQPLPAGCRVAIVGNAGGSLAIVGDAVVDAGLELAELGQVTRAELSPMASHEVGPLAVVDLGLAASGRDLEVATAAMAVDPGVDCVLLLYAPSLGGSAEEVLAGLDEACRRNPEVTAVACFYGPLPPSGRGATPVYDDVGAAARALGRVAAYAAWRAQPIGAPPVLDGPNHDAVVALVADHLGEGRATLSETDALAVADAAGLAIPATEVVVSVDDALTAAETIGYPVVLKAAGRAVTAKTAGAGFAIDLEGPDALSQAWVRMEASLGEGLRPALVQPMLPPGVDVRVAVSHHDVVGPVLLLGAGGAAGALDTSGDIGVLPLGELEVERFVASSRPTSLLGDDDRRALEALLLRVSALVEAVPEVCALELNPVIVAGGQAMVTQARASVQPVPSDPRPQVRRL